VTASADAVRSYIDKDVVLGRGVRIQNGVSVYKGVTLEDEVFVGPNVTFTNDFRPRAFDEAWTVVPTRLARRCSVGASATIMCGLTLGAYSMISAGAVVTVDTLPHGLYIGNPARLKGFVSKLGFEMAVVHSEDDGIVLECPQTGEEMRIRFEFLEPRGPIAEARELPE
jgi:UDP-3-O-[3-hydroxymyristoyl] glucosamine N-acyltransferase